MAGKGFSHKPIKVESINTKYRTIKTEIPVGNILTFDNVTKEHRGTYYCVATNVVGQGARRNVDVEGNIVETPFIKTLSRYHTINAVLIIHCLENLHELFFS